MNVKTLFFYTCSALMLTLPLTSQAAIIDGTFKATVASGEPVEGLWGDLVGSTVTGTFSYDTALFDNGFSVGPNEARYFSGNNSFVSMTFHIAGQTFDVSHDYTDILDPMLHTNMVIIKDRYSSQPENNLDYFAILDSAGLGDPTSNYSHNYGQLYFFDSIADFINGTSLEQEFSWVGQGTDEQTGYGSFQYNQTRDGVTLFGYLGLSINEVSASIRKSSVPEPAPLLLFSTALLALVLRFRK
ncbi:MAG: hypothetical protein B0W54_23450 [Cellvibrio sp. 79]|nr:MAG: hypothetical protein B0W54_23450 [Cellvibrio sp. 79]